MALILEANYSKKLGLPNYSSHQYSITLRCEISKLEQVEVESTRLYKLLQECVDRDIREVGYLPGRNERQIPSDVMPPRSNGNPPASNGNGHNERSDVWNCSDKQKALILKIVEDYKLDKNEIEALSKKMFEAPVKALNKLQASGLIKELLDKHTPKNGNGGNRSNGYRKSYAGQGAR